jgi:hypothetical protein
MNIFNPKGRAFGRDPFNSADTEGARIYPDLPIQKVSILPLGDDPQNVLKNTEVLLRKKTKS